MGIPALAVCASLLVVAGVSAAEELRDIATAEWQADAIQAKVHERVKRVITAYRDHLREHPDDHLVAIEECEFLETADELFGIPEDTEIDAERPKCGTDLKDRFPGRGEVALYVLERSWGEEGVRYGESALEDSSITWTDPTRAKFHEVLAWRPSPPRPRRWYRPG